MASRVIAGRCPMCLATFELARVDRAAPARPRDRADEHGCDPGAYARRPLTVLVDRNVLLDVLIEDPEWSAWSEHAPHLLPGCGDHCPVGARAPAPLGLASHEGVFGCVFGRQCFEVETSSKSGTANSCSIRSATNTLVSRASSKRARTAAKIPQVSAVSGEWLLRCGSGDGGGAELAAPRRPSSHFERNDANAARRSATSAAGCSHAAKCPPLSCAL